MNSFYLDIELKEIGFKSIGNNVKISRFAKFYQPNLITIGNNVRIDDFCILSGHIVIGNNIHISSYSALFAGDVGITMKDFSGISSRVTVYAVTDDYNGEYLTNPTIPNEYRNVIKAPVILEKHVIIGASSIVLPGVVLAEGSAFGSMSLINKSSLEWSLNIGIPAKFIKNRSKELLELEEQLTKKGRL